MRFRPSFLLVLLLVPASLLRAQSVDEPPIPVTIVCPYHEDSLRRAYESGFMTPRDDQRHVLDSMNLSTIRAAEAMTAQMERSFLYLYLLLGLLALTSFAALRVAYRLRIELQDIRNAQRTPPLALPSPVLVTSTSLRPPRPKTATRKNNRRPASASRKVTRARPSGR
ncbi:MAG: hypothetical protein MUE68_02670 [Bacteroidetes bacterium]|jgi:hypothetical protein|nr:hypothetical protein [Bacteroidota bacterium]